jgi:hypothetical protein
MQSIGVAVLATILSSAVTLSIPSTIPSRASLTKLPPAQAAQVMHLIQQFQDQYITGLQHAYLATFIIAVVATILALFLPGWPGKYLPASQRGDTPAPQKETKASIVA